MGEDKILVFLDSSAERAAVHCQRMTEADQARTFWTQTVVEVISIIKDYLPRLEEVSLEHDLGEEPYVHSGSDKCGMEVVRYLERCKSSDYASVKFIVHTHNEIAGQKMTRRLRIAGYNVCYSPFGLERK